MKKRKLISTDDGTLMNAEEHNDSVDDNLNPENEIIDRKKEDKDEYDENEDGSDNGFDYPDGDGLAPGAGEVSNDDESSDIENISKYELKARLYREINNMNLFEFNLDADEGLTNIDLIKYIDVLKVP